MHGARVRAYQGLISDIENALQRSAGILTECFVDLLSKGLLLNLDDKIDDGDVGGWHTQCNTCAIDALGQGSELQDSEWSDCAPADDQRMKSAASLARKRAAARSLQ